MKLTPQGISEMTLPHGIIIKTVLWVNDSNLENLKKKQTESDYNRLTRLSTFPCSSHMLLLVHILMLFLDINTSKHQHYELIKAQSLFLTAMFKNISHFVLNFKEFINKDMDIFSVNIDSCLLARFPQIKYYMSQEKLV